MWETFTTSQFLLLEKNHNDMLCVVLARSVLALVLFLQNQFLNCSNLVETLVPMR